MAWFIMHQAQQSQSMYMLVYKGVIYEAAPTRPGISLHGYPWTGNQGRPALPPRVLKSLRQDAAEQGCIKEFEAWLKKYS